MRRKDRMIADFQELVQIIDRCTHLHLGLSDAGIPYIVPLNFGYRVDGTQVTFYFHSAAEGRKIDLMKANPHVCFEMDCSVQIQSGEIACHWTTTYESIIGYGDIAFLSAETERKAAMDAIMKHCGFQGVPEYQPAMFARTLLFQLTVTELTGKRR